MTSETLWLVLDCLKIAAVTCLIALPRDLRTQSDQSLNLSLLFNTQTFEKDAFMNILQVNTMEQPVSSPPTTKSEGVATEAAPGDATKKVFGSTYGQQLSQLQPEGDCLSEFL